MSSKKLLKEAREAINNKDYQTCIKLCKKILEEDKSNYMALVFFGIALTEAGPAQQAPDAYKKAIQLNRSNWIAYNGLASYYEKYGDAEEKKELFDIYKTIIKLDNNEKRIVECAGKILKLRNENVENVAEYVLEMIDCDCVTELGKATIRTLLCSYLCECTNLSQNLILSLKDLLKLLINNHPSNANLDMHNQYIKLLYDSKEYELALDESIKCYNLHRDEEKTMLWISKIYNKLFFDNYDFVNDYYVIVCDILNKHFIEVDGTNTDYLFSESIFLYIKKNFQESRDLVQKVVTSRPHSIHAWILKMKTELALSLKSDALLSALKSSELIMNSDSRNLKLTVDKVLIELLSYSSTAQDWEDAIQIYEKNHPDPASDNSLTISVIRANIKLNRIDVAEEMIGKVTDKENQTELNLFRAQILKAKGKLDEALTTLEGQTDNDWESSLEAGNINWELEKFDSALFLYLKAAKLNPSVYEVFLKLGRYYQRFDQVEKARRCFEKVIKLRPKCLTAATELSQIYKLQKNWDGCVAILQTFIECKPNSKNLWAWVQLGLTYYEKGDYAEAVNTLRIVIRLDPNNRICWEALGDAYLARGAYTSSIKSYQQALDLHPGSIYPQIRIASIQQMLGQYKEAKEQFQSILTDNKLYVPALKGLAETYLGEAKDYRQKQLWGLARDAAQMAVDTLSLAVLQDSRLSCVWKLLGDCCYVVAHLSERYCCLLVYEDLLDCSDRKSNSQKKYIEREEIFEYSVRCLSKAIVCIESNVLIWHDLANCLLSYSQIVDDPEKSKELYNKAFAAIHRCIIINPGYWTHWNLMGVLAYFKEPKSYSLCQHAFIKATTLDKNCAVAWCNLGTLYLHLNEMKLANKAFSQAQRCDPNYINSWVGQALIAELLGREDCMDLFRHSTELGCHSQSQIGYAYWVCKVLLGEQTEQIRYAIYNMHAIPIACDSLVWYTELHPDDPCGWNMLGLLKERMRLKGDAMKSFKHSLVLMKSDDERDKIFVNYGRSLIQNEKYDDAVQILKGVNTATFTSGSSLALALFKNKEYEESYGSYESALHWLTDNNELQSDLLVALASMAYLFEGHEAAKTLLFQSLKLKPPSPWGFYSTLAIGLLHHDLHLAQLVLNEMSIIKDKKECLGHYSVLCSYFFLLKGESKQAVREVCKLLHRHPDEASLWLSLSTLLIRLHKERPKDHAATQCARIAMELGQSNMDVTNVLSLVSLSLLLSGDYGGALKAAQKAIHYYPNMLECWAILTSSLLSQRRSTKNKMKLVRSISAYIQTMGPSDALLSWLNEQTGGQANKKK